MSKQLICDLCNSFIRQIEPITVGCRIWNSGSIHISYSLQDECGITLDICKECMQKYNLPINQIDLMDLLKGQKK